MTSMRKRCLFARSQLITAAQSGSSWERFCSFRYETSSSRFSLEGVEETAKLITGHGVRAFTFSYFSISSRLILNELALLILETKLAITCGIVALIEAMLPQSQKRCILQEERNIPSCQSLTYLRLGWVLPNRPAGFEQAVRRLGSSLRDFFSCFLGFERFFKTSSAHVSCVMKPVEEKSRNF